MKKSLFLLSLLPISLMAFSIQGDVSYFRPNAHILREIYGKGWVDYKLTMEGSVSSCHWFWSRISVFGDVSYLHKTGRSLGGNYKTEITIVPVSLGIKWVQPIGNATHFYLGAAPRYFFLRIHDHLSVVREKINKNGLGGMAISGFTFDLWKGLYLDLFASYSYKKFNKPSVPNGVQGHSLQVGGLDVGGGFGWHF